MKPGALLIRADASVAIGTGIGYFICNLPLLFTASPETQAAVAAVLCFAGIGIALIPAPMQSKDSESPQRPAVSFPLVLASFTALVWLDSAAFFIIQNTPELKAGTWRGSVHLGANGLLHLGAALLS